jgi:hypothetical protein
MALQMTIHKAPIPMKTKNSQKKHPRMGIISKHVVMRVPRRRGQKNAVARDFLK